MYLSLRNSFLFVYCILHFFSSYILIYSYGQDQFQKQLLTILFLKIVVLENLANFTGKNLCWNLFLNNLHAKGLQLY